MSVCLSPCFRLCLFLLSLTFSLPLSLSPSLSLSLSLSSLSLTLSHFLSLSVSLSRRLGCVFCMTDGSGLVSRFPFVLSPVCLSFILFPNLSGILSNLLVFYSRVLRSVYLPSRQRDRAGVRQNPGCQTSVCVGYHQHCGQSGGRLDLRQVRVSRGYTMGAELGYDNTQDTHSNLHPYKPMHTNTYPTTPQHKQENVQMYTKTKQRTQTFHTFVCVSGFRSWADHLLCSGCWGCGLDVLSVLQEPLLANTSPNVHVQAILCV